MEFRILKKSSSFNEKIAIFSLIKNEIYLLPHFLDYYRKMGIKNFCFFDDNSSDGTLEYLFKENDCTIIQSPTKFGEVVGMQKNGIPLRFCTFLKINVAEFFLPHQWTLIVDLDEFLVLPRGYLDIHQLIFRLEEKKQYYLPAPMVTFYPEYLSRRHYSAALNPFLVCLFFDKGPYYINWELGIHPQKLPMGIELRLYEKLVKKNSDLSKYRYIARNYKIPIVRHGKDVKRLCDHSINLKPSLNIMGTLAHFKFTPNIDEKVSRAIESKAYHNNSVNYLFYKHALEHLSDESLLSPVSVKFTGVESLEKSHLSVTDIGYGSFPLDSESSYWSNRKDHIYLSAAKSMCLKFSNLKRVIDVGSRGTPILEWFGTVNHRVSIDLFSPYVADGVQSIKGDFMEFDDQNNFDLLLCLQVLEHLEAPKIFAKKILKTARFSIISVPYKWKKGWCNEHLQDPVDENKLYEWFEKLPLETYLASEINGTQRLVHLYEGDIN